MTQALSLLSSVSTIFHYVIHRQPLSYSFWNLYHDSFSDVGQSLLSPIHSNDLPHCMVTYSEKITWITQTYLANGKVAKERECKAMSSGSMGLKSASSWNYSED